MTIAERLRQEGEQSKALHILDANNGNNLTVLPLEQLMGKKAAQPTTTTPESVVNSAPVSTQERRVETQTTQPVQSNEGIRQGRFN